MFFPSQTAATAVLVLSVLDGFATIIGLRYGRIRIINRKSVEGSIGAVLITILVLVFLMPPVQAVIVAVVAGIIELGSPIDDNLVIPVVVASLLTVIPV
jgi:dolichol kinase